MKKGHGDSPTLHLRVPPAKRALVDLLADQRGVTPSIIVREALDAYLEAQEVAQRAS